MVESGYLTEVEAQEIENEANGIMKQKQENT